MKDLSGLLLFFPQEAISWRAQNVTRDGTKALALAYIDARDVMARLDEVCGLAGWQCTYPHANGKTICSIGIKCDSEWVWKADGAGDTDVEAEKGAISDAFKRAAVKWGIGRYLYDDAFKNIWVPCESYKAGEKFKFSSFKEDPWNYVKKKPVQKEPTPNLETYLSDIEKAPNLEGLKFKFSAAQKVFKSDKVALDRITKAKDDRKAELEKAA